ncbi:MAG: tetratricopeptide repeat protein [Thermoguttaceae bacterium]
MANKYELRRRAVRSTQGRSDNPFASPRDVGGKQPSGYTPPPPMDRRGLTLVLSLGLVVLITALYVQTAGHRFTVCDDNVYIYEKPQIVSGLTWDHVVWAFADAHEGNWHPLTWISHMLDWQLFSQGSWEPENLRYKYSWPGGHHLVSMGIHCVNAVLLFLALRLMTGTLWPSFVVAALFGVHPLRVESVAWAAERKDVLCGLFWMASMLAYTCYARRRPISESSPEEIAGTVSIYVLVTVFIALGLMSKSMIVTLPCVFMLLDIWPLGRWKKALGPQSPKTPKPNLGLSAWLLLLLEKMPWLAMVIYDCQITVYGQNKGVALNSFEGLPMGNRLLNAVVSCGEYLRQTVWPTGLAPFYTHPAMIPHGWTTEFYVKFAVYTVLLPAITGAAIWFFRQRPFLAVGWFWYLGTLLPVIGIIQVGTQARADRYTYLPMIGVYLMVAWLLMEVADRWPKTRVALATTSVVVLIALCVVTFRQVGYWVDSYKVFKHAVQVTDNNYFAYNHIGIAYDADAREMAKIDAKAAQLLFDRVAENFEGPPKILDDARRRLLFGDSAESFKAAVKKLDFAQQQQLLFDYSADNFKAAIDIKPDYDFGHNNLGVYYARRGGPDDLKLAEKYFTGALRSNQRYADAYNNLAIVLARQGRFDDAIACHKLGLNVRPDRASDHTNFCRAYMQKGDLDSALEQNTVALQCDPNYLGAWMSRAEIYFKEKKLDEAAKCLQRMIAIDAKSPETRQIQITFAANCLDLHRPDDAIALLSQSLSSNDAFPELYDARGHAYMQKGDLNRAKEDFEQVVRLLPQFSGARENLKVIEAKLANPHK